MVDLNASANGAGQAQDFLTRGPLHEAFAGPYEANATPSGFVEKAPPEPINELPPDHRPEGDNVLWISGYWSWDEDRSDYLWISGVWRKTPPGQRWIPGYWENVEQGNRWISGFWASDKLAEVDYLPLPPESLEQGPSSPAPQDDYFYIPGNWVYASGNYQWQPGYWAKTQPDWVWSPSQYAWTPSGCVYRQGYWDYDVPARGVVFAPVYYNQPIYQSSNYSYRPQYAIDTGINLFVHLFVRPNQRQYYFGDYYGQQYSNRYQPWVTTYQQRQNYDPFYTHYQNRSRNQNTNVLSWINNQHQFFQNDSRYRPPQTIAAQQQFIQQNQGGSLPASMLRLATFGESFDNLVSQKNSALKFQALTQDEENQFDRSKEPLRELSQSRRKLESQNRKQAANANLDSKVVQPGEERSDEDKNLKPNPKSDQAKAQALDRPRINEATEKQGEINSLPNRLTLPRIDNAIPNNLKPGLSDSLDPLSKDKSNGKNRDGRNPTTGQDRNRQDPASKPDAQALRPAETQGWPDKPRQVEKAPNAPPTSPNANTSQKSKAPLNPESDPVSGPPKGPQNRPDMKSPSDAKGPNERLRQPGNVPKTPDAIQKKLPGGSLPSNVLPGVGLPGGGLPGGGLPGGGLPGGGLPGGGLPGGGLPGGGLPGVGRAGNGANGGVSASGVGAANAGGAGVGASPNPRPATESLPRLQQNAPKGNAPSVSNPDRARGSRPPKASKAPQLPSGTNNGSSPLKSIGDSLQKTIDPGTKK
jgi:hypothetical protein